jgi:hypothetical protein
VLISLEHDACQYDQNPTHRKTYFSKWKLIVKVDYTIIY